MFVLRDEGCFRYPSAVLQFVLSRMIKRLAENDKSLAQNVLSFSVMKES